MQGPGGAAPSSASYSQQARKGLKRQPKDARAHQAQEIALMVGNQDPMMNQQYENNSDLVGAYGHSFHPAPQSSSMPHLQPLHQHQMQQQHLSISSPLGQGTFYQGQQQQQTQVQGPYPQTAVSSKMFHRGGGMGPQTYQQNMQQRQGPQTHKSSSSHMIANNQNIKSNNKAAVKASSLLQQQLLEQQQYGGGVGPNQKQARHGNHQQVSNLLAANQKMAYPLGGGGVTAISGQPQSTKLSRSRTQLSANNLNANSQQALMVGAPGTNSANYEQYQMGAYPVTATSIGASGGGGHNNLMMRQCTSATLTRPKRNGANSAANTTMQGHNNQGAASSSAGGQMKPSQKKSRKPKQPQINNLVNSSLMVKQKGPTLGSTKHMSRPMTSLQQSVPPLMSVTPQGGSYAMPLNLNATTQSDNNGYAFATMQHQQQHSNIMIRSSRSNLRAQQQQPNMAAGAAFKSKSRMAESPMKPQDSQQMHSQKRQKAGASFSSGKKRGGAARGMKTPKNLIKSPPSRSLHPDGTPMIASDSTSRKMQQLSSGRLNSSAVSSILTVTVLQAKLKVDMSSFLAKMQVYCQVTLQTLGMPVEAPIPQKRSRSTNQVEDRVNQGVPVILDSLVKKTATLTGKEPKWSECFVFDLKGAAEYLLEISVWSTNYLVSDSCLGRAFLKFEGSHSETGSITNWLTLKSDSGAKNGGSVTSENGEIFVSISKEAIMPKIGSSRKSQNNLYKHLVQNTEECAAISGDLDDHQTYLQENDLSTNLVAPKDIFNNQQQRHHLGVRMGKDESEVNSAEDDDDVDDDDSNDRGGVNEQYSNIEGGADDSEEPDEGLESPVDDIILEEEMQREQQRLMLAYQTQQNTQMFLSNAKQQQQNLFLQHQAQQQQQHHTAHQKYLNQLTAEDGGETTEDGELDEHLQAVQQQQHNHGGHFVEEKSEDGDNGDAEEESGFQSCGDREQHYSQQPQQQVLYHTGGFQQKQQTSHFERLSDEDLENGAGPSDDDVDGNNDYGQDGDDEDSAVDNSSARQQQFDNHQSQFQQHHLVGLNPNLMMQLQQQTAADELIDLQKDIVEENARLRQEVISIDKIQKKIERQNKQIKREKSSLKQLQAKLKSKSKRLEAQQEDLVYKRQQMEKESIRVNKSMQKMRRMKQTLDATVQLCSQLVKSEIFSKLQYEASLTQQQHPPQTIQDTSEDWLLAMQAHEFVTGFDKVAQLLEHLANDNALQGMATGSGDLNNKSQGGATTIQTTQHQQHNSQSSFQTQEAHSANYRLQNQPSQTTYQNQTTGFNNMAGGKSQQFMSDDTSICGDRILLAGISSHSPFNEKSGSSQHNGNHLLQKPAKEPQTSDNYWTHSSIREIRATGQQVSLLANGAASAAASQQHLNENSTPHLPTQGPNNNSNLQFPHQQQLHHHHTGEARSNSTSRVSQQQQQQQQQQATTQQHPLQSNDQLRFHTEVNDNNNHVHSSNQDQIEARQMYQQHLNVSIGKSGVELNNQNETMATPAQVVDEHKIVGSEHRNESAHSSHDPASQLQQTPKSIVQQQPEKADTNNSRSSKTQIRALMDQTGESSGGGSNFQRQQEMYNDLIGQMSKELSDIQMIKQNLLQLQITAGSQQQSSEHHQHHPQLRMTASDQEEDVVPQLENGAGSGLEQEQMQFLLEQESANSQARVAGTHHQHHDDAISQATMQHSSATAAANSGGEPVEDDKEVEGYIWESMQRNAERMHQLRTEKGIQDPVELERELLRNFQTQGDHQTEDGDSYDTQQQPDIGEESKQPPNQDEQKFTSSYIIDTSNNAAMAGGQETNHHDLSGENQRVEQPVAQEEEDDELEFKFDPDFLNKINANMALNDQVFEQRQQQLGMVQVTPPQQQQQQQPRMHMHDQDQIIQQCTLQGEQIMKNHHPGQDENSEADSYESRERVAIADDGPSFVMDYSHNNDLRQSAEPSQQNSLRPSTAGLYILQNTSVEIGNKTLGNSDQPHQAMQQNSHSNGTGSGGAAPATLLHAQNHHQIADDDDGFQSPKATRLNLLSSRESQKGSVMVPNSATHQSKDEERLINTVEKLDSRKMEAEESHSMDGDGQPKVAQTDFMAIDQQQMTAKDFEISNRASSVRGLNEPEDEILKLINESYMEEKDTRNLSVIYKDDKVYDQPKRAVYGIQPVKEQ